MKEECCMAYKAKDVAEWFLSKEAMSPKKLQKLTYYAEAWSNALLNRSMISDDKFQAWVHGPVSPVLYQTYKDYKWNDIPKVEDNSSEFDTDDLDLLESVWLTYGENSANDLEALTHTESPWLNARAGLCDDDISNNLISTDDMREYYSKIYIGD